MPKEVHKLELSGHRFIIVADREIEPLEFLEWLTSVKETIE